MAARPQTTFYPSSAPACIDIAAGGFCRTCNISQDHACCTSTSAKNGATNVFACGAVCNTCQNTCNSCQAYCQIGVQKTTSHSDVKQFPSFCMAQNEIIIKNWTAVNWNKIIANLQTAYNVGRKQKQGAAPAAQDVVSDAATTGRSTTHAANSLVKADRYNEVVALIGGLNGSLSTVAVGDVIKSALAVAQKTGYDATMFNASVCDICNAGGAQKTVCPCPCNCSCACSCSCGCDCPCSCDCGCVCPCDCDCGCSCDCDCDCSCSIPATPVIPTLLI